MKHQSGFEWFKSIVKTEEFQGVLLAVIFFNVVHLLVLGLFIFGLIKLGAFLL